MVNAVIDKRPVSVEAGTTILDAARAAGIHIPHLCYLKGINEIAACRLCVVEVEGIERLVTACDNEVLDGMVIDTNSPRVRQARRTNLRLLLSQHDTSCTTCIRSGNCELQTLAQDLNIHYQPYAVKPERSVIDLDAPLIREAGKCIKCMRCVQVCDKVQDMHIWDVAGTGSRTTVDVSYNRHLKNTACVFCGQCVTHCPTGALSVRDDTNKVLRALADPEITTVVQVAPAVRVAWAEVFGVVNKNKQVPVGKLVAALKQLGFDYVFDTNFTADLTIMEEGSELLDRIKNGGKLPMITSCSPGWVTYMEKHHPELCDNLSTAKSPQGMFGAVVKTYYAQKMGWDPHDIVSVSVMPCTAKKYEASRPELGRDGYRDVDYVLTTRELAKLIRYEGLDLSVLPESEFDSPLGIGSGAGAIFGATGGVMEAALRTAYEVYTGQTLPRLEFEDVRNDVNAIKEATIDLNGTPLKVAIANGLKNAEEIIRRVESGEADYIFIEIMACPGGCIGGGGQPIGTNNAVRDARIKALYEIDRSLPLRKSHENPEIKTIYEEFFGAPLSHRSHELLHTHYHARPKKHDFSHLK